MTKTSIPSGKLMTRKQEAKIADNVIAILRKLNPSAEDAQRIIKRSNELQLTEQFLNLGGMRYRDEEVESLRTYPASYKVKLVCEQLLALVRFFPGLDPGPALTCTKNFSGLPDGAEGWFAIPKFEKVAGSYNEAVEKVLKTIALTRSFYNYRQRELGPKYLRLSERTTKMMKLLGDQQPGDFLVIPSQFGLRHRGRSVRRSREVFKTSEFGHGSFASGCMLLSHPERLQSYEDLFIDCAGDEFAPAAGGRFPRATLFYFYDGKVEFSAGWAYDASAHYGSASGFLPQ